MTRARAGAVALMVAFVLGTIGYTATQLANTHPRAEDIATHDHGPDNFQTK